MIAETGSTESGGDKAAWIRQALTSNLPGTFPAVKALIWFNINKETNWNLASSSQALNEFKNALSSTSFYNPTLQIVNSKVLAP